MRGRPFRRAAAALSSLVLVAAGCSDPSDQKAAAAPATTESVGEGCATDGAGAAGPTAQVGASPWAATKAQQPLAPDARVRIGRPKQSSGGETLSPAPVLGPNGSMLIADFVLKKDQAPLTATTGTILSLSTCKPRCTFAAPSGQTWGGFKGGIAGYVFLSYDASLQPDDPNRTWALNTMDSDCNVREAEIQQNGDADKFPRIFVGNASFAIQRKSLPNDPSFTVVPLKGAEFDVPGSVIGVGTAPTGSYLVSSANMTIEFATISEVNEHGETLRELAYNTNQEILAAAVTESSLVVLEVLLSNTRSYALMIPTNKPGPGSGQLSLTAPAVDAADWAEALIGCDNRVGYRVPGAGSGFLEPAGLADATIGTGESYSNFSPNVGAVVVPNSDSDTVEVYRCGTEDG